MPFIFAFTSKEATGLLFTLHMYDYKSTQQISHFLIGDFVFIMDKISTEYDIFQKVKLMKWIL